MAKNGIILTGGTGSRLFSSTVINKHLLPVNGKFIIDYPIETLKRLGVENITVVLGANHYEQIVKYLKDGSSFETNINYVYQEKPLGIAQAVNLCKRFVSDEYEFNLILGDNLYIGDVTIKENNNKAGVVIMEHPEIHRFGVASIEADKIYKIEEKPKYLDPNKSHYAITGCYKFNQMFFEYYKDLKPSKRGEFEISEIIEKYWLDGNLDYSIFEGDWVDAGTTQALTDINYALAKKDRGE